MGQGSYTGFVWGRIWDDMPDDVVDWIDDNYDLGIHRFYESKEQWAGVPILGDNARNWNIKPRLEYAALALSDFSTRFAAEIEHAQTIWEQARVECPALGEGQIIIVADYD